MANDKSSAREAALLAQVRAELARKSPAATATLPPAQRKSERLAARLVTEWPASTVPPAGGEPAVDPETRISAIDPKTRIAELIAAERAASKQRRWRQQKAYVLIPLAIVVVAGLWLLVWLWHRM